MGRECRAECREASSLRSPPQGPGAPRSCPAQSLQGKQRSCVDMRVPPLGPEPCLAAPAPSAWLHSSKPGDINLKGKIWGRIMTQYFALIYLFFKDFNVHFVWNGNWSPPFSVHFMHNLFSESRFLLLVTKWAFEQRLHVVLLMKIISSKMRVLCVFCNVSSLCLSKCLWIKQLHF